MSWFSLHLWPLRSVRMLAIEHPRFNACLTPNTKFFLFKRSMHVASIRTVSTQNQSELACLQPTGLCEYVHYACGCIRYLHTSSRTSLDHPYIHRTEGAYMQDTSEDGPSYNGDSISLRRRGHRTSWSGKLYDMVNMFASLKPFVGDLLPSLPPLQAQL